MNIAAFLIAKRKIRSNHHIRCMECLHQHIPDKIFSLHLTELSGKWTVDQIIHPVVKSVFPFLFGHQNTAFIHMLFRECQHIECTHNTFYTRSICIFYYFFNKFFMATMYTIKLSERNSSLTVIMVIFQAFNILHVSPLVLRLQKHFHNSEFMILFYIPINCSKMSIRIINSYHFLIIIVL